MKLKSAIVSVIIKILQIFIRIFINNIIALESLNGFDGSTAAIYEYMLSNRKYKKYKFVWLVRDKSQFFDRKAKRTYIFDGKSRLNNVCKCAFLKQAKYILYECDGLIQKNKKQKKIYLTHGCPPLKNVKGILNVSKDTDYSLCTSKNMIDVLSYQFSYDKDKFIVCGLPRNDELFSCKNEISKLIGDKFFSKIIMWMPTFRKSKYQDRNDTDMIYSMGIPLIYNSDDLILLNDFLVSKNILLILKMHPGQDKNVVKIHSMSNIMLLWQDDIMCKNISLYALLAQTDALITDYSSVAFDYMLIDKPLGYVIDDIDEYKLGFAYENVCDYMPGHKINNLHEFKDFISDIVENKDIYRDDRNKIRALSNDFPDGNNTIRFLEKIGF